MRKNLRLDSTVVTLLAGVVLLTGCSKSIGQQNAATAQDPAQVPQPLKLLTGQDALIGDWRSDAPAVRRKITIADLPPPYATDSSNNQPHGVARPDGAMPVVGNGFSVQQYASGLAGPRHMATAPNGDVFVTESGGNDIKILRGVDASGKAQQSSIFVTGLHQPFGLAFYPSGPNPKYVYIANTGSVVRYPYKNGDLVATGPQEMIVPDIPGGGHLQGGGHWTRDIAFSQDDSKMFVSVGSHSNVDDDPAEFHRADILQYNPDGTGFRIYASGIRNPVGIAVNPKTGVLWTSVNERDQIGDLLPSDYITHVEDGGFYGWPWYYLGSHQDPRHKGEHPELSGHVIVPDVLLQAHSASLQMAFYNAKQFPKYFQGGAFACEHGSWNRSHRTGYKVIYVPMKNGKATGEYDDFMTGFVVDDGDVWGRPVGVTVGNDGSLYISDDGSNSVWRVSYTGKAH